MRTGRPTLYGRRMQQINISLTDKQRARLNQLAVKQGKSPSQIIRDFIDAGITGPHQQAREG